MSGNVDFPDRWRSTVDHLLYRGWDDEFVVFSESDNSTHLLDHAGWLILSALAESEGGLTLAELADILLKSCVPETTRNEATAFLAQLLAEFQRLGLAKPRLPA